MEKVLQHLRERHLDVDLHRPVIDEVEGVATLFLWNLSGMLVGYQQYRPNASKAPNNDVRLGRYFTRVKQPTIAVWGVESLDLTPHVVFVTEGVFDAARITERGHSAIAVLSNDPKRELRNWLKSLARKVVVVCDNDSAGRRLAKFGDVVAFTEEKDLGDSSEEFVTTLLEKYGSV
jgi:Toprim-like